MKDSIIGNQSLFGQRELLQLFKQITSNIIEIQDLRKNLMCVKIRWQFMRTT